MKSRDPNMGTKFCRTHEFKFSLGHFYHQLKHSMFDLTKPRARAVCCAKRRPESVSESVPRIVAGKTQTADSSYSNLVVERIK